MLGDSIKDFPYLVGTFIKSESCDDCLFNIFLLFRQDGQDSQLLFDRLSIHPYFVSIEDYKDEYKLLTFNTPLDRIDDYLAFTESKYSEFDLDYKKQIIMFHNLKGSRHPLIRGLFRDAGYREELEEFLNCDPISETAELLDCINEEAETLPKV